MARFLGALFTRGGGIDLNYGALRGISGSGYYWSSIGTASSNAYDLHFNGADTIPSLSDARWYGFSENCI